MCWRDLQGLDQANNSHAICISNVCLSWLALKWPSPILRPPALAALVLAVACWGTLCAHYPCRASAEANTTRRATRGGQAAVACSRRGQLSACQHCSRHRVHVSGPHPTAPRMYPRCWVTRWRLRSRQADCLMVCQQLLCGSDPLPQSRTASLGYSVSPLLWLPGSHGSAEHRGGTTGNIGHVPMHIVSGSACCLVAGRQHPGGQ